MRLELVFSLENPELPKDNKSIWLSFLKNVLSKCNKGKFYESYFSGTNSKDYSFSILLSKPKFVEEKVLLENNQVKMIFSAISGFSFFSSKKSTPVFTSHPSSIFSTIAVYPPIGIP